MNSKLHKTKNMPSRRVKLPRSRGGRDKSQFAIAAPSERHVSFFHTERDVVQRLAVDARDPKALVALYEMHGKKIRQAAIRWFGQKPEICNRAVNNILVSIGKKAATYDPKSVDVADWIQQCAEAEARRLHKAVDAAGPRASLGGPT